MPRTARKDLSGRFFHVMVQGIGKENIFSGDNGKGYYLRSIQKAQEKIPVKLLAFCVMENHAHLLLCIDNTAELAIFMNYANAEFARYYNRVNKRVGYVFRDRFKSESIKTEKQLCRCLAYIQNNPVKAGVTKEAETYKYSSYINYLTGNSGIVDFQEAAKYYGTSAENMRAIMTDRTEGEWLRHDGKEYESKEEVLAEVLRRYNISSRKSLQDDGLLIMTAREIKERCGISLRETAALLEVNRERLRKLMSTPPSP